MLVDVVASNICQAPPSSMIEAGNTGAPTIQRQLSCASLSAKQELISPKHSINSYLWCLGSS